MKKSESLNFLPTIETNLIFHIIGQYIFVSENQNKLNIINTLYFSWFNFVIDKNSVLGWNMDKINVRMDKDLVFFQEFFRAAEFLSMKFHIDISQIRIDISALYSSQN